MGWRRGRSPRERSLEICASPSKTRQTSVVVPPMSKLMACPMPRSRGDAAGGGHSGRGSGCGKPERQLAQRRRRGHAARGVKEVQPRPGRLRGVEPVEVARRKRHDTRAQRRGGGALVLPGFRVDAVGERDEGAAPAQPRAERLLVGGVCVGVQQRHRDRLGAAVLRLAGARRRPSAGPSWPAPGLRDRAVRSPRTDARPALETEAWAEGRAGRGGGGSGARCPGCRQKPRVATRATSARSSSTMALVTRVVPCTRSSTSGQSRPTARSAASRPATRSSEREGTFATRASRCAPCTATTSVNVPPTSTPTPPSARHADAFPVGFPNYFENREFVSRIRKH